MSRRWDIESAPVVDGLRRWAAGSVTDEAAVELLASLGGRFTSTARPWVRPCMRAGWFWLDPLPLAYVGRVTPEQARVLHLVGVLLSHPGVTRRRGPAARPVPSIHPELGRAA